MSKELSNARNLKPMKNRNHVSKTILIGLACFAFLPLARAVSPSPDGGYPGGNTAEGYPSLQSLTTGAYNTGVGVYSLLSITDGNFCTGVGAGTLLSNTGDGNTASGAGALLSSTAKSSNKSASFRNKKP